MSTGSVVSWVPQLQNGSALILQSAGRFDSFEFLDNSSSFLPDRRAENSFLASRLVGHASVSVCVPALPLLDCIQRTRRFRTILLQHRVQEQSWSQSCNCSCSQKQAKPKAQRPAYESCATCSAPEALRKSRMPVGEH